MHSGNLDSTERIDTICLSVAASSTPGSPQFTSSMPAPASACSFANFLTKSNLPARNSACKAFFPVGFSLSPITQKGHPAPSSTTSRELETKG